MSSEINEIWGDVLSFTPPPSCFQAEAERWQKKLHPQKISFFCPLKGASQEEEKGKVSLPPPPPFGAKWAFFPVVVNQAELS